MPLHFSMQEEDILEHTNAKCSSGGTYCEVVSHQCNLAYASRNRVSDTITHVTLNTINGVVLSTLNI